MNLKLQTKSRTIYAFLMALFSVWGWGQTYNLVTSATQLEAGSEYIIAGTTSNDILWVLSTAQTNNNRTAVQNGTATSMPATVAFQNDYASFVLGESGQTGLCMMGILRVQEHLQGDCKWSWW